MSVYSFCTLDNPSENRDGGGIFHDNQNGASIPAADSNAEIALFESGSQLCITVYTYYLYTHIYIYVISSNDNDATANLSLLNFDVR